MGPSPEIHLLTFQALKSLELVFRYWNKSRKKSWNFRTRS